jgi:putative ABC transport system permease protein
VDFTPPTARAYLNESELPKLKQIFWRHHIINFTPYLSALVKVEGSRDGVGSHHQLAPLVGTWFEKELITNDGTYKVGVKQLNPWWEVQGDWIVDERDPSASLIGTTIAKKLGLTLGDTFEVTYEKPGHLAERSLRVVGIVSTGGFEDNQLFVNLSTAQSLLGLEGKAERVQVSALTMPDNALAHKDRSKMTPEEYDRWYCSPYVSSIAHQIETAIPDSRAKAIRQITQSEGRMLSKIQMLLWLLTASALFAAALGVMSTMTTTVMERRGEVGLLKAIGAENSRIATLFWSESTVIGMIGGALGYGLGVLFAQAIGQTVFGTTITPEWIVIPLALIVAVFISILGSLLPIRQAMRFEPATVLHGN